MIEKKKKTFSDAYYINKQAPNSRLAHKKEELIQLTDHPSFSNIGEWGGRRITPEFLIGRKKLQRKLEYWSRRVVADFAPKKDQLKVNESNLMIHEGGEQVRLKKHPF